MYSKKYYAVLDELNRVAPGCDYRNCVIATAFERGKTDRLTDDWLRKALLGDYEDGFITYGQALALNNIYKKAIADLVTVY